MYEVYGAVPSRAFRVLWMLEELEQPYTLIQTAPRSDEILALNPLGKIPAMRDGDAVLTDSTAIMTYLADKHQRLTFAPGTPERATQDAFTFEIIDEFDAILWSAAKHSFVLPKEQRQPDIKASLKWEFARAEDRLAERLADDPFLMGETMTVPDILLTHCLGWAITAKFGVSNPVLSKYLDRNKSRDAYLRARNP